MTQTAARAAMTGTPRSRLTDEVCLADVLFCETDSQNEMEFTNMVQMDAIDRSVVEELQRDSRATYAEIGARVSLSAAAVHARVKNLERRGVLTGFGARVDAEAVGW